MYRANALAFSGPLILAILLLPGTPLHAQPAPSAGTTVAVKMLDTIDSGSDPAGKQYRASVTKAVTASNGIAISQGAAATVTLASSGSGYTAQLSSITIGGQSIAVTSSSASVTSAAQSAAASAAANAVGSMLGGFGHHVSAPASVAAVAMGQHILLPMGTTLTFVLASSPTAPTVMAAPAPAAAPSPASSPTANSSASVSGGIAALVVCYSNQSPYPSDPNNKTLYLSAAFETSADRYSDATLAFSNYLKATYHDDLGVKCLPIFTTADARNAQTQLAGFAAKLKAIDTGWRLGQPPAGKGQSGFDPLAQGPGGIDLAQHRQATYFCSFTAAGGTTMAVDMNKPNWNANMTTYVSPVFQADWDLAPVSMAYNVYIRDHYVHDLNMSDLSPRCGAQSPAMQTMQHQTAMISNKRTGKSVLVDFTDTAAQTTTANAAVAQAAAAATAAAAPTAAANQNYVWCNSAWGGTAGTMMPAGTVMYFSDVFPADMPPPVVHVPGHAPPPPNANGAQINKINALQTAFFAFLQKKYGYKDSGNYPVDCRTGYPPTVAGLQNAEKYKQQFEDEAKQNRGQIVETGWKNQ